VSWSQSCHEGLVAVVTVTVAIGDSVEESRR
jgi:hypothetical protein